MIYLLLYVLSVLVSWAIITLATKIADDCAGNLYLVWVMLFPIFNILGVAILFVVALWTFTTEYGEKQEKILKFLRWIE